jgi:hypothetical protein
MAVGGWGFGIVSAAVLLAVAALVLTPKIARYMCPPDCGRPPTGTPVMALPRFAAPDGTFTVSYPAPGSAYLISTEKNGVTATFAVVRKAYPDARFDYGILHWGGDPQR